MSSSTTTIHSTSPDARVVFFPYKTVRTEDLVGKGPDEFMATEPLVVQEDLISVSTSKSKGGVGSFTIQLSPNQAYKGLIEPGCWCLIYLSDERLTGKDYASMNSGLKMLGIVKSVRRTEQTDASGRRFVSYQVGGEDFQAMFNSSIYLNGQLTSGGSDLVSVSILGAVADLMKIQGSIIRPDQTISILLESLLGPITRKVKDKGNIFLENSELVVGGRAKSVLVPSELTRRLLGKSPEGNYFSGMMTYFLPSNLPGASVPIPQIGGVVSVWSLLQSFCNPITNEIYTDLLPASVSGGDKEYGVRLVPSFVLRPLPFSVQKEPEKAHPSCEIFLDAAGKQNVPRRQSDGTKQIISPVKDQQASNFYVSRHIEEHEILSLNSGKSDHERFNFFFVTPSVGGSVTLPEAAMVAEVLKDKKGGLTSLANVPSLQRYGLRPYIASSQYFVNNDLQVFNRIVKDMWKDAYLWENGSVSLVGSKEHIPVGTNIVFVERGWEAHVERVDHEWSVRYDGVKAYHTNIAFTRLQTKDGKPVDHRVSDQRASLRDGGDQSGQQGDWDRGTNKGGSRS